MIGNGVKNAVLMGDHGGSHTRKETAGPIRYRGRF